MWHPIKPSADPGFGAPFALESPALLPIFQPAGAGLMMLMVWEKSNNLIPSPIPPCPTMSHQGDENWKLHHTCRCSPNPISIKAIPSALPAHGPSAISLSFRGHWMALLFLPLSGFPSCVSSALVNVFARMGSDSMKPPFGANLWMRRSEPK